MTGTCSKYEFESLSLNQLQKRTELLPLADFVIKKLHGFSSLIFSAQLFRLDFDPELNFCFTSGSVAPLTAVQWRLQDLTWGGDFVDPLLALAKKNIVQRNFVKYLFKNKLCD